MQWGQKEKTYTNQLESFFLCQIFRLGISASTITCIYLGRFHFVGRKMSSFEIPLNL